MAKLEVWPLELQGFAIVSTETAERLRLQYEPYVDIEQTPTWGDFRRAGHPFDMACEIIDDDARGDLADYVAAVESASSKYADTTDSITAVEPASSKYTSK